MHTNCNCPTDFKGISRQVPSETIPFLNGGINKDDGSAIVFIETNDRSVVKYNFTYLEKTFTISGFSLANSLGFFFFLAKFLLGLCSDTIG